MLQLNAFSRRPFVRNVAAVATGTAASQAIGILFSPLITRLYGPDAFGLQSIFVSIVGLLATVAGLGYSTAIVLPRNDEDAFGLVCISMTSAIVVTTLTTLLIGSYGTEFLGLFNAEAISNIIYLIPIAMLITVLANNVEQWLIRKQAFLVKAKYDVISTLLISLTKSFIGFVNPSALYLILTNTVGKLISAVLIFIGWRRQTTKTYPAITVFGKSSLCSRKLGILAREYYDFPLLRTPQNLINSLSQSLPVLILSAYASTSAAGQYSIAITVLGVPAGLIGSSVMTVFYPRVTKAVYNNENPRNLIIKATLTMAVMGALPFLIVITSGPGIFEFVFGNEWKTAGYYAQLLSPWLFLQYINKPAVSAIPALRLQGGLLLYELFSTGTKILALWFGFIIFKSDITAIALFSTVGVIAYTWLILWVIKRSTQ